MSEGQERPSARVPVYLLAGGLARRFGGGDKLRAEVDGVPLLAHVAREMAPLATRVVAVAERADKYADLGIETIGDNGGHDGPLAGLLAALADLRGGEKWIALVAGDLARLRRRWLEPLLASRRVGDLAVAFHSGELWQPLFALYARGARRVAHHRHSAGERSMQHLLDALEARAVTPPEDWERVVNINNREELEKARGGAG